MPDTACAYAETRALAARKLALIEQKMTDLAAMHQVLGGLVERCDAGDRGTDRPISDVLAGRITSSWVAQFSISSHEPFDSPENMGQYAFGCPKIQKPAITLNNQPLSNARF